jgi:hypothetical protein
MYGSTCFGRLSAHHQGRKAALGTSGFTVGALLIVVWQVINLITCQTTTNNAPTTTFQR